MRHPYIGSGASCPIPGAESAIHLRKAISHLLPRDVIVDHIYDGIATPGITAWNPICAYFDDLIRKIEKNKIM